MILIEMINMNKYSDEMNKKLSYSSELYQRVQIDVRAKECE